MDSAGMNGVVSLLHANKEALLDLQEFEHALNALWENFTLQEELWREVVDDVTLGEELNRDSASVREMIKDRVLRAQLQGSQLNRALGELCRVVRRWGIAERGASNRPRSVIETPPPVASSDVEGDEGAKAIPVAIERSNLSEPRTMQDVVRDLTSKRAGAVEELQELRDAVRMIIQNLGQLALTSRGLTVEARSLHERTLQLNEAAEQAEAAVTEIENGIRGWQLPEEDGGAAPLTN